MISGQKMITLQTYMNALWSDFKKVRDTDKNLGLEDKDMGAVTEKLAEASMAFMNIISFAKDIKNDK
jgi:hypothetical protein